MEIPSWSGQKNPEGYRLKNSMSQTLQSVVTMSDDEHHGVFELDEEGRRTSGANAGSRAVRNQVGPDEQLEPHSTCALDPFRRAMPQVHADEDVCSICLDAFTDEDPGNPTSCE